MMMCGKAKKKIVSIIMGVSVCLSVAPLAFANAVSTTAVGRYLTTPNTALPSQMDLLAQTFQIRFPASIKTIREAIDYLLQFSGYSLVEDEQLPELAQYLINNPLPQVDRALGPLSLENGLLTLVGKPFGLLVDPVHRLISFRLFSSYQSVYLSVKKGNKKWIF